MWRSEVIVLDAMKTRDSAESTASIPAQPTDILQLKHDVKNQLTSILCFCSLLRQSAVELKPKDVDSVNRIQGSTKAILLLLNGLHADHDVEPTATD
jgi:hypothetical protein